MKHSTLLIIILFSFMACGKKTDSPIVKTPPATPPTAEISSYSTAFRNMLIMSGETVTDATIAMSGHSISVEDYPANEKTTILGKCYMGTKRVTINRYLWNLISKADKEELIFHELGHCILNRLHDNTLISGVPKSIMYPYHLGPTIYVGGYEGYMVELFSSPAHAFAGLTFDAGHYASTRDNHSVVNSDALEFKCLVID